MQLHHTRSRTSAAWASQARAAADDSTEWADPDQPGLGKREAKGGVAAGAPGQRPGALARHGAAIQAPLQVRRTPLCARVTRWLLLAGAGVVGLGLLRAGLRPEATGPASAPPAGPVGGDVLPGIPLDPPHDLPEATEDTPELPRPSGPASGKSATRPGRSPAEAVRETFRQAGRDGTLEGGALPLPAIDRLIATFLRTRYGRKVEGSQAFMAAMIEAAGGEDMSDEHLSHLLRVWTWSYGDVRRPLRKNEDPPGNRLKSLARQLGSALGGPRISDAKLERLIAGLCQLPADVPAGSSNDDTLLEQAGTAGLSLGHLVKAMTREGPGVTLSERRQSEAAQLQRSMRILLEARFADIRWKPMLIWAMGTYCAHHVDGTSLAQSEWTGLMLQVLQDYLRNVRPESEVPADFSFATYALYDLD